MKQRYYVSAIAMAAVAAALAGCGGGGGGSSSPVTPTGPFSNMKTNSFVFAPLPTSSSAPIPVNPKSGGYTGGTVVTLNGTGTVTGPVTVYFGTTPGTNPLIVNNTATSTSINVISPAGAPATSVDVRVVDANGVSAVTASDKFFFVPPPPNPPPTSAVTTKPSP